MAVPIWVWDKSLTDEQKTAMIEQEIRVEKIIWKIIFIALVTISISLFVTGAS